MPPVTCAASIVGLSNDLLPEILLYLPVKTLLKFKLVCKKWNFIISDVQFSINQFRKTHNRSSTPSPAGLFLYHSMEEHKTVSLPLFRNPPGSVPPLSLLHKLPLDFSRHHRDFYSCNGLLLCRFVGPIFGRCAVYNPTTGDFKLLPLQPDSIRGWYDGLTLVFNPFESHHYSVVSLWKDSMVSPPKLGSCKLSIYSSETQSWTFSRMVHKIESHEPHKGAFFNGTIYWIGLNLMHCYNINSQQVVSLDLPPEITRFNTYSREAYFAGGHPYIVVSLWNERHDREFKIFEFDYVNMKWSYLHTVLLSSDHFGTKPKASKALAVLRGKEKGDFLFVFKVTLPDTLMIYDLVQHKLVETHAVKSTLRALFCDYVPSLIPV